MRRVVKAGARRAGARQRFAGRIVALAAPILVGLTLLDSAMIISTVQSAGHGQNATLRVSFDLIAGPNNDAIGRSFLIAPAILLPLGFVILQTRLLPRSYGWIAIGFGAASQALGLLGLFGKVAFADVNPAVLAPRQPLADHGRRHPAAQSTLARTATRRRPADGRTDDLNRPMDVDGRFRADPCELSWFAMNQM